MLLAKKIVLMKIIIKNNDDNKIVLLCNFSYQPDNAELFHKPCYSSGPV